MHENPLLGVMLGARKLETHRDLFKWLQKDVQALLQHDILVAVWGDFSGARISLDVVSALPGVRTTEALCNALQPFLVSVFHAWLAAGRQPFFLPFNAGVFGASYYDAISALPGMKTVIAHGIKDERGQIDCLYVALSRDTGGSQKLVDAMAMMVPHIDAAFRQVSLLPLQRQSAPIVVPGNNASPKWPVTVQSAHCDARLSNREQEIMQWVSVGKKNLEISQILNISPSTVRNHLQNVFRKLDVINRSQAVFAIQQKRVIDPERA